MPTTVDLLDSEHSVIRDKGTMGNTADPLLDLELSVDVPLSPAQLFEGWTDPELLKKWFCPRPWKVVECSIDLRPGGLFSTVMQSPDGQRTPENHGCYLLIEKPTRLVWTGMLGEGFRPNPIPQLGFGFVCDLRFIPLAQGGTRFQATVMHSDPEGRTRHEEMGFDQGWRLALSQLVELYQAP
jgi:uncharacterized protein YndB with AHSA1/START domain